MAEKIPLSKPLAKRYLSTFAAMIRVLILLFFLLPVFASGQRKIEAFRISEKIVIDGILNEKSWAEASKAKDFKQITPSPGSNSGQQTTIQFLFDKTAIYFSIRCVEQTHLVSKVLSLRDDFNANVDNIQILLDTYNDDQNAFIFGVSSMGVQYDAKVTASQRNADLNMVWSSAVVRNTEGWQAEIRIPYSAIRFPKEIVQNWGINFFRYTSHSREESSWNPVNPDFNNYVAQCGEVTGLSGITPPTRLAFMPYVSAYADHFPSNTVGKSNWSRSWNGGMDIKYGVNEAFTLDMTLVPDFGQVQSDNQVLNLSPFEIQFNENRQFFTEGTELFGKAGLFYSRRIGVQSPPSVLNTQLKPDEYLTDVPAFSQLFNATKLSGRTKKGLGIGVFNALTAEQKATAVNTITGERRSVIASPLSNYTVLVLDQNLKNNSFITLTNTNVAREGRFYDANVSGLNFKLNTSKNTFFVAGNTALSAKLYTQKENQIGHNLGFQAGKQTGKWIYSTSYFEESTTYDPNDLGFNTNNNKRSFVSSVSFRKFKPFWRLNRFSSNLSVQYDRLYAPNVYTNTIIRASAFANSRKFHASGIELNSAITDNYDYFEPRSPGRYFTRPRWLNLGAWISTNYQKRFAIDVDLNYVFVDRDKWKELYYSVSPRIRVNDKLFIIYAWNQNFIDHSQGYAIPFGTPAQPLDAIIFGSRNRRDYINTLNINYTLTNTMGATFRMRHYRSVLEYHSFFSLQDDGSLAAIDTDGLDENGVSVYNTHYNAFTIDLVFRWVFLPGSEINIVWKNALFSNDKQMEDQYTQSFLTMFENSSSNSFSIKLLYWLDYNNLKKKNN